jgi:hypothetical protein
MTLAHGGVQQSQAPRRIQQFSITMPIIAGT